MQNCTYCSQFILVGGVRKKHGLFCSEYCATEATFLCSHVRDQDVNSFAWTIRGKKCPSCKRNGPIDIQPGNYPESYFVRSVVKTKNGRYEDSFPELRCGSCGFYVSARRLPTTLAESKYGYGSALLLPGILVRNLFHTKFSASDKPSILLLKYARYACLWEAFWDSHLKECVRTGMPISEYCEKEWLREDFFLAAMRRAEARAVPTEKLIREDGQASRRESKAE